VANGIEKAVTQSAQGRFSLKKLPEKIYNTEDLPAF